MNCPHCNAPEDECVPAVVYRHTESYGSGLKHFECESCGKVVEANCTNHVTIDQEHKSEVGSDW